MADDSGPAGGTPLAHPVWAAWSPADIARRLAGVRAHWYVAGGWALDLSRGKQRRDHDDLEIGVPAASFRRDETIRLPYQQIIRRTPAGIPYLVPEIVLLFKARHGRPKDAADFEATLPLLRPAAVESLRDMLARVHPGHAWLGAL